MKYLYSIILLITYSTLIGQSNYDRSIISNKTNEIIQKIKKINVVKSSGVGFGGFRPEQYDNFIELKNIATINELIELTDHPNEAVRCYSFWALTQKNYSNLFPIILRHIQDEKLVSTHFGCLFGSQKVGDFFIDMVSPRHIDANSTVLNSKQISILDSILIFRLNNLHAKKIALDRVSPVESYYLKIKELTTKDKDLDALVALAKYQKPQDVDLIIKNRESSLNVDKDLQIVYEAMSYYPHPDFFPLLKTDFQKALKNQYQNKKWKELYNAIASYKNNDAKANFLSLLYGVKNQNTRKYHINYTYEAIRKNKSQVYEELFWKFWLEENKITSDIYDYLALKYPDKVLNHSKATLLKTKNLPIEILNNSIDFNHLENSESLTISMLNHAFKLDSEFAFEAIRSNILNTNVSLFPIFANKVSELKDKSFIEPLFERLKKESNAHIYLKLVNVLVEYDEEKINQRIIDTIKLNKNLQEGWGGESLKTFLNEKNIK